MSLSTLNTLQLLKNEHSNTLAILGIAGGVGQIALGVLGYPEEKVDFWTGYPYTNEGKKALCFVNVGIGTTTMIQSTCQLFSNRTPKERSTTWNVFGYPTGTEQAGVGIAMVKRF